MHSVTHASLPIRRFAVALASAALLAGCEGAGARATAPRGADAFARFAVIGGAIAAGVESGGLVMSSQVAAWPALLATAAGVPLAQPLHRAPGCPAPLIAPLVELRLLTGAPAATPDSACAGLAAPFAPPGNNLAIAGATAWDALNATPKTVAAAAAARSPVDRARYPAVLASTQSQVTAALVSMPTLVAAELGLAEVFRAATGGLVVTATAYNAPAGWTLVPPAVSLPVVDAIADSLAKTGAKVVLLSVPAVTRMPAFRAASDVWAARAALLPFGIAVEAGCATSSNVLNVAGLVPALAQRALAAGAAQPLSCADVPGTTDGVLTPADVSAIESAVAQFNAHLRDLAAARQWAFADLDDAFSRMATAAGAYDPVTQLTCVLPYGVYLSLDGIHPAPRGQQAIADAVATALNARYGFALPVSGEPLDLQAPACP
jgi:lysophospholipase L1-like esterase